VNDKYLVSQSAIAEVLNVSREAVRKWRSCPRNKNGDYHLPSVVSWYVNTKAKSYKLEVKQLRERLKQKDEDSIKSNVELRGQIRKLKKELTRECECGGKKSPSAQHCLKCYSKGLSESRAPSDDATRFCRCGQQKTISSTRCSDCHLRKVRTNSVLSKIRKNRSGSARKSGYIYLASSPEFCERLKLGRTSRLPSERVSEQANEWMIHKPEVLKSWKVIDSHTAETAAQTALAEFRIVNDRELYQLNQDKCIEIVESSIQHLMFNDESYGFDQSKKWLTGSLGEDFTYELDDDQIQFVSQCLNHRINPKPFADALKGASL
jgi:predicted transcriptional regulator